MNDGERQEPRYHGNRQVLDDVRAATRLKGSVPLPELNEDVIRCVAPDADVGEIFRRQAESLGVSVIDTAPDGLLPVLEAAVARHGNAVVEPALIERFPSLAADLPRLGTTVPDDETLFAAGLGITGVEYAIAETGSLVVASGAGKWRQFSFVPPVHLAVVERAQIVPDLVDVLRGYGRSGLPANCVVITGPSRTADIAQRLVTGVHGPVAVECVLVE